MKKSLLLLAWIAALSISFSSIVSAQLNISELFSEGTPLVTDAHTKLLNEYDGTRWYSDTTVISCESKDGITITTPIIDDAVMDKANIYNLFFSPYRISQIKSWDPAVDTSRIIMRKLEINNGDEDAKFTISAADVDPDTAYYAFIAPADMYDEIWTPSKEICFQLTNNICLQDMACDTLSLVINPEPEVTQPSTTSEVLWSADTPCAPGDAHCAASCAWMDLAHVTHTIKWDTVTLKWNAVDWDSVQIAIFDPESEIYKSLWTANMKDEKFDYKMQWNGEQNFMLTNGCKEVFYKADATISEPEKIVTPATGPAENILYIAIAAIILYGAYTIFGRKSEN